MTAKLTPIEECALALLDTLATRQAAYDKINTQLGKLMGDFPSLAQCVDDEVGRAQDKLLDAVFGSDIADYYLHECIGPRGHGGEIECCAKARKKPWKLRNIDDLRRYLIHAKTCPGLPQKEPS